MKKHERNGDPILKVEDLSVSYGKIVALQGISFEVYKGDIVAMLGDENKFAGRIADIEQWLARSGSSQLQFLLGYVYYRTGQMLQAKQTIDAAYEKTPESPAVQAMKIVIDNNMTKR